MDEIKVSSKENEGKSDPDKMVQPFTDNPSNTSMSKKAPVILILVLVFGVLTGFGLYRYRSSGTVRLAGSDVEVVKTVNEEGVKDASTFRDTATGNIVENDGKLTDEGTHILVRGDASQNVYLTSSVIDLSKYIGKKVQIWGETFGGQKAGWLMDVGRIKVLQ
jgi:hypothetical protein